MQRTLLFTALAFVVAATAGPARAWDRARPGIVPTPAMFTRCATWRETVAASRDALLSGEGLDRAAEAKQLWRTLDREFPVESDWMLQDLGARRVDWLIDANPDALLAPVLAGIVKKAGGVGAGAIGDGDILGAYLAACEQRRARRLKTVREKAPRFVFAKHFNMGASHYAYVEGQSDAQAERHFYPGSELCLFELAGTRGTERVLIADPAGVIRDPDVSWDGKNILFAWKKSDRLDDYHLYEMAADKGTPRQVTFGLGFADYEGAYLPNGDLVFTSTRCVQTVDCWWTEVSNLFTCGPRGEHLRRLTFDQVHVNYPQVLADGRVTYTRWEYIDRGQVFVQSLFQMNMDGTAQTEFYGNNSWFPTSLLHARGIPGTGRVVAIASGHHSSQAGKLVIVDPRRGRQENSGVQLVAPIRDTPAVKVDSYGQGGPLWMYPFALNDEEFLVSHCPEGREGADSRQGGWFRIYYMHADGSREVLAADPEMSCHQPVALASRPCPTVRPSTVNYAESSGVYYMQDVYVGEGMKGVTRGAAKALRVVELGFRPAGVGSNGNRGPAGGALSSTPPSVGNGTWDTKRVLGLATIHADGSAMFRVPARRPVLFQVLDATNHVIQTMRSWSTLQPGELFSCTGCHEAKNETPPVLKGSTLAMQHGVEDLTPFHGPARWFSYLREVQPVLDRHCVRCHDGSENAKTPFGLRGTPVVDSSAKRQWAESYLVLTGAMKGKRHRGAYYGEPGGKLITWVNAQSTPPVQPPYAVGAAKSPLIAMLRKGHHKVELKASELDVLACWIDLAVPYCGDYREAHAWDEREQKKYDHFVAKRMDMETIDARGIDELLTGSRVGVTGTPVRVQLIDGAGNAIVDKAGVATPETPLSVAFTRPYQRGDRLRIEGPHAMMVLLDEAVGPALLHVPEGVLEVAIPVTPAARRAYPPTAFGGADHVVRVRPASYGELDAYRNVAGNPYDPQGDSTVFPHASSNSECRGDPVFAARNAIDGHTSNRGHGRWPYQSWGPEQSEGLWWKVELGREMEIDRIDVTIRADFPHDKHWHRATLVFSDGKTRNVRFEAVADVQSIALRHAVKTSSVEIRELVQEKPPGWCALTEIAVWGRDAIPVATDSRQSVTVGEGER